MPNTISHLPVTQAELVQPTGPMALLLERALAGARPSDVSKTPHVLIRGGTKGKPEKNIRKTEGSATYIDPNTGDVSQSDLTKPAQTTPPSTPERKGGSRALQTTKEVQAFLQRHARFDWLALTIPNGTTGKGTRSEGDAGAHEEHAATLRLCAFAAACDLYELRTGRGTDGFRGAMALNRDPLAKERMVTIRTGHSKDMPGIEITGAGGQGHVLATKALKMLGVVLCSRVDVAIDVVQEGLFDQLYDHARTIAANDAKGRMAPPILIDKGKGRSFTIGGSKQKNAGKPEAEIVVYEKGFEQTDKGKILPPDVQDHWVRIEVRLRPRKERKTGIAKTARQDGPAALLGTVRWVRLFIREAVRMMGISSNPTMGVTRLDCRPDPEWAYEKAKQGIAQYAGVISQAVVVGIVKHRFSGDYRRAEGIYYDEVITRGRVMVADLFEEHVRAKGTAERLCQRLELDAVRCSEERAARLEDRLLDYMEYQAREEERAQSLLTRVMKTSRAARMQALALQPVRIDGESTERRFEQPSDADQGDEN
jgi:hypothetical protein